MAENISHVSSKKVLIGLYSVKPKKWKFFEWKKCKSNKSHAFKGYGSSKKVQILNSAWTIS